jgi:hypothetical protein
MHMDMNRTMLLPPMLLLLFQYTATRHYGRKDSGRSAKPKKICDFGWGRDLTELNHVCITLQMPFPILKS